MSRNTPWRTTRRMYALHQGANDWYRIKNADVKNGKPAQVHIYDEIGYFGVGAGDLIRDLADVQGPIDVHINSPGGEVFDGIAIYNALVARSDVTVYVDGIAASIASVIAMAGNPVLIARQATMMIHEGFGQAIGNAADMREFAELLEKQSNNIASIYSDHTGKPASYWRELMKAETWLDAAESIEHGLADRLIETGAGRQYSIPPGDKWDMSVFRAGTLPAAGEVSPSQHSHKAMSGHHTHVHSAHGQPDGEDGMHMHHHHHDGNDHHDHHHRWDPDGDGDDDSTAAGDTDHSHWDANGRQIMSVPGRPLDASGRLIDIRNASVDNSAWDGGRAMHNAASSDSPASFYKGICAGRREGPADQQSSWALPHHYHPGDAPNVAGVKAALGRLGQTQGLSNSDAAKSHLEAHMRAINPDWNPSDSADNPFDLSDEDIARISRELRGV